MSEGKPVTHGGYIGYGLYNTHANPNGLGSVNSPLAVNYASYTNSTGYLAENQQQGSFPTTPANVSITGLYTGTAGMATSRAYAYPQQHGSTPAVPGTNTNFTRDARDTSFPLQSTLTPPQQSGPQSFVYGNPEVPYRADVTPTVMPDEARTYPAAFNSIPYAAPTLPSAAYLTSDRVSNPTKPLPSLSHNNTYSRKSNTSSTPAPAPTSSETNNLRNLRSPQKKNYARKIPNRPVDISSAPNPSRDIPYTTVPPEAYTSAAAQPFAALDFISIDDGNASSKFVRLAQNPIFLNKTQATDANVPFGAVLSPLCQPLHEAERVPLVEGRAPVRCQRCRAYLSCHSRFIEMGKKWQCMLCEMTNDVEQSFFANLDVKGMRVDYFEKPDLSRGTVEYAVDTFPEYMLYNDKKEQIPTRPLHYLFLIDISKAALGSFLPQYVEAVEAAVISMAEINPSLRVSFITFASKLHFYNFLDPRLPQYCVADVDNPFVPIPFSSVGWLEVGAKLELIRTFLGNIIQYASDSQEPGCVLGAAVQVAMLVFAGQHGGRVVMCANQQPQSGVGAIVAREQRKLSKAVSEKEFLRPMDGFWTTTATAAAKQQISFDLFMFPNGYCELVTLSQPSHLTNGNVHLFANYDRAVDGTKVRALMEQMARDESGYAAVLRVRCSTGLKVERYHGHFLSQTVHDMDLANITGDSTFFVEFAHEDSLEKQAYAYFQAALLYTTRGGNRRLRVHSVRAMTANSLSHAFTGCDLEGVLAALIYKSLAEAVNKGLKHARDYLSARLISSLTSYRRYCTKMSNTKALLMPSRLKLLALYVLCLLKSDALTEGSGVRIDERENRVFKLLSMPIRFLLSYLYPSLYSVHDTIEEGSGYGRMNEATQRCILPRPLQLIYDNILTCGVYLLSDEQARVVYMWIGSEVDPEVSQTLFGGSDANIVYREPNALTFENFDERLQNIIYALTSREDGTRRFVVIHQGERGEEVFFQQLKEEKHSDMCGYDEWLSQLHEKVKSDMLH